MTINIKKNTKIKITYKVDLSVLFNNAVVSEQTVINTKDTIFLDSRDLKLKL